MKPDALTPYKRINAKVLAVQLEPGLEDNWIAVDHNGVELSRASTVEGVQRAVGNAADYAPIVDLPGLEGKPLKMGDYIINDGDGVYWIMERTAFEDAFGEADDSDDDKKDTGKGKTEATVEYGGKKLSIAELMQELQQRDKTLEQLASEKDTLAQQLEQQRKDGEAQAAHAAQLGGAHSQDGSSSQATDGPNAGSEQKPTDGSDGTSSENPTSPEGNSDGTSAPAPTDKPTEASTSETGKSKSTTKDPLDHDENGKKGGAKKPAKKPASKTSDAG